MSDFRGEMAFFLAFFVGIGDKFCDAERGGVERCLGNEAIGKWNSQEPGDSSSQAKEKNIPMKAGRLSEWKFGALGY
jgi:hypothetical protein